MERRKSPIYSQILKWNLKPDKKLQDILTGIKGKQMKIAVASSSNKEWVELILGGLGIRQSVDAVVAGDDVEKSKPAPDIFLETAKKLEIKPDECIVVEDAPAGIKAANAAKMYPIAFETAVNRGLDLSGARKTIEQLEELLRFYS